MDSPEVLALKGALSAANLWNEVAAWCSVLGGVVGLVALLIYRRRIPFAEKAMLVTAGVLVLLGGGGRLVFGARASIAASQLQQLSDQKVANLKRDQEGDRKIATQAAAHAADLGVTVDTLHDFVTKQEQVANAQFAKFKVFAENERKRNDAIIVELNRNSRNLDKARSDAQTAAEESKKVLATISAELSAERVIRERFSQALTPRNLTAEQEARISKAVRSFKNVRFDIAANTGDPEALNFSVQVAGVLKTAGWEWIEFSHSDGPLMFVYKLQGMPNIGEGGGVGVSIRINTDHASVFSSAASALSSALNGANIPAYVMQDDEPGIPNHDTLHVVVGKRSL